jgi:flagellar basal-body rod protein FlgG
MGSPSGIWTAVSGGMAQSQNVDIIANNLANANTTGFKKDTPTFKEYLTAVERPPSPAVDIPRTAFKDSDFYHTDGREHAMVNLEKVHVDHGQGTFKPTNSPFDMAIDGAGFFTVQTPSGYMFTRAGDFKVNAQGQLVTVDGLPVLALGPEAAAPEAPGRAPAAVNPFAPPAPGAQPALVPITLADTLAAGQKIHVTSDGQVYAGSEQLATIAVAEFADAKLLKKVSSTLYENPDPANVPRVSVASRVRQGFIEASNVNPVSEVVNLIKANRMFESNMKAIKAYSDMAGKEANEVGKL